MNKQANHAQALAYQSHIRNLERRNKFMQQQFHGMRMKPLAHAVRSMFQRGLPAGWGLQ